MTAHSRVVFASERAHVYILRVWYDAALSIPAYSMPIAILKATPLRKLFKHIYVYRRELTEQCAAREPKVFLILHENVVYLEDGRRQIGIFLHVLLIVADEHAPRQRTIALDKWRVVVVVQERGNVGRHVETRANAFLLHEEAQHESLTCDIHFVMKCKYFLLCCATLCVCAHFLSDRGTSPNERLADGGFCLNSDQRLVSLVGASLPIHRKVPLSYTTDM